MWQKNKRLNVKRYTYMLQHQFAKEVNGVKKYIQTCRVMFPE